MLNTDRPLLSGSEPEIENSMWSATAGPLPPSMPLGPQERCDIVIIGGGFNGVTAGLRCSEAGAKTILVEAKSIGAGATGRNAGMVNPGQFLGPDEIKAHLGAEFGERFVKELGGAPDMVRAFIKTYGIQCYADYRPIIRAAHSAKTTAMLEAQTSAWQALGAPVEMVYDGELQSMTGSSRYRAAMMDNRGFTIQPLAYIRALANVAVSKGLRIAAGAPVQALEPEGDRWRIGVGQSSILADKVILSTNAYTGNLIPDMRDEIMPLGAFGFATDPLPPEWRAKIFPQGHSLYDTHKIPLFFRYDPEGRLKVGCIGFLPREIRRGDWAAKAMRYLFPDAPAFEWRYRWSGTLGQSVDRLPHLIEPLPGILGTIGCNGRGIAPNTYFGTMLARLALGEAIETPLPIRKPKSYPRRRLAMESYDAAIRLYRNTALFS